ncbi:MAG: GntR family transcriptional regulator [Burkholderiales bacterium PBB5]|nr:MAG: GntR family transcriptional regulator [Burkholderiales bacterium PBB5]
MALALSGERSAPPSAPATAGPRRLPRNNGTALHRQIFLVLRDQILRGFYAPAAALPAEEELGAHFGVSRITVRRALGDLQQLGLVDRFAGRGTFVSAQLPQSAPFAQQSLLEALQQVGRDTQVQVLAVRTAVPPTPVALQMHLRSGEPAVYTARLRHMDNTPLMVLDAWVPLHLGQDLTAELLARQPLYTLLMAQGLTFTRFIDEVTAVTADPELAGLLATEIGMPLLRITRMVYDQQERPVEHVTVHLSPQRSRILLNVPTDSSQASLMSRIVHDVAPV